MTVAEVAAAEHLFDHPVRTERAERSLTSAGHHLYLAYESAETVAPVGFASGVETVHPDKGAEMLLYELGVAESHRRRGIGRALEPYGAERYASNGQRAAVRLRCYRRPFRSRSLWRSARRCSPGRVAANSPTGETSWKLPSRPPRHHHTGGPASSLGPSGQSAVVPAGRRCVPVLCSQQTGQTCQSSSMIVDCAASATTSRTVIASSGSGGSPSSGSHAFT
nr:GNAT family N-acetyltransferase [Streptomyces sp. SID12501]